jgi:predicted metal-binding protein
MRCGFPANSAAVPATVSEEPKAENHWECSREGGQGDDPRARRPAVCEISDRLAGVPGKEHDDLKVDGIFPQQVGDAGNDGHAGITVVVCSSCRDETGSDARPRAGEVLGDATRLAAQDSNISVRQIECLGNCKRRLSAAILREGSWSYVFGDLTPDSGPDLITGAKLFATSTDGILPWRGRPDSLKRGLVARIPPLDLLKENP